MLCTVVYCACLYCSVLQSTVVLFPGCSDSAAPPSVQQGSDAGSLAVMSCLASPPLFHFLPARLVVNLFILRQQQQQRVLSSVTAPARKLLEFPLPAAAQEGRLKFPCPYQHHRCSPDTQALDMPHIDTLTPPPPVGAQFFRASPPFGGCYFLTLASIVLEL